MQCFIRNSVVRPAKEVVLMHDIHKTRKGSADVRSAAGGLRAEPNPEPTRLREPSQYGHLLTHLTYAHFRCLLRSTCPSTLRAKARVGAPQRIFGGACHRVQGEGCRHLVVAVVWKELLRNPLTPTARTQAGLLDAQLLRVSYVVESRLRLLVEMELR